MTNKTRAGDRLITYINLYVKEIEKQARDEVLEDAVVKLTARHAMYLSKRDETLNSKAEGVEEASLLCAERAEVVLYAIEEIRNMKGNDDG